MTRYRVLRINDADREQDETILRTDDREEAARAAEASVDLYAWDDADGEVVRSQTLLMRSARILLDGYVTSCDEDAKTLRVSQDATWEDCQAIANEHDITLLAPGELFARVGRVPTLRTAEVVLMDSECIWAVRDGRPKAVDLAAVVGKAFAGPSPHKREVGMDNDTAATIDKALAECEASARKEGWAGEWKPQQADMEHVAERLGRPSKNGFTASELEHIGVSRAFWSSWRADWAIELVAELKAKHLDTSDEATRLFCEAYAKGDSVDAWSSYKAHAEVYDVDNYTLLAFADGSVYANWQEGIDQFYPNLEMVREQCPDEMKIVDAATQTKEKDVSTETIIYASDSLPSHWVVGGGERLWLVPARPNGWDARTPYRGHKAALQPCGEGIALGARRTCGIPAQLSLAVERRAIPSPVKRREGSGPER